MRAYSATTKYAHNDYGFIWPIVAEFPQPGSIMQNNLNKSECDILA